MHRPDPTRTGLVTVRVWIEESDRPLRARITGVTDLRSSGRKVTAASSIDEICKAVRSFLEDFVTGDEAPPR